MDLIKLQNNSFLQHIFKYKGPKFIENVINVLYVHEHVSLKNPQITHVESIKILLSLILSNQPTDAGRIMEIVPQIKNTNEKTIQSSLKNLLFDENGQLECLEKVIVDQKKYSFTMIFDAFIVNSFTCCKSISCKNTSSLVKIYNQQFFVFYKNLFLTKAPLKPNSFLS